MEWKKLNADSVHGISRVLRDVQENVEMLSGYADFVENSLYPLKKSLKTLFPGGVMLFNLLNEEKEDSQLLTKFILEAMEAKRERAKISS